MPRPSDRRAGDPYGRPLIGRNDWVRQPGDRAGPRAAVASMNPNMGGRADAAGGAEADGTGWPAQTGPRGAAMKDEFGFRYDAQGNRLDARGNIISPQTR